MGPYKCPTFFQYNFALYIKHVLNILPVRFSEETVSLDSPPPESSPNFGDLLSHVMPDDSREIEINNDIPLQQRAPGSHLRNGSMTVNKNNSILATALPPNRHSQRTLTIRRTITVQLNSCLTGLDLTKEVKKLFILRKPNN